MTESNSESTDIEIPAEDEAEFLAFCAELSIEVPQESKEVVFRDTTLLEIVNYVSLAYSVVQPTYAGTSSAVRRFKNLRGKGKAVDELKRRAERLFGGYLIRRDEDGHVIDERRKQIAYGHVRAIGPDSFLDIDAQDAITDEPSGQDFVNGLKPEFKKADDLHELASQVKRWKGVRSANLFNALGEPTDP